MRLTTLLKISSLLLVGCAEMPEKPSPEMGVIDYPRLEIITNIIDGNSVNSSQDLKYEKVVEVIKALQYVRKPISAYDKALCFLPPEWEKVQVYIHLLEEYARKRQSCQ